MNPIESAPWDEYVIVVVPSGVIEPLLDYVQCKRYSNGYYNNEWVTVHSDHLTESHTEDPIGWLPMSVLNTDPEKKLDEAYSDGYEDGYDQGFYDWASG